ncbi:MAG: Na/Pi cotransporter family protein [Spirochaetes bacterium]|nr:Na/Pi cotransporter family protein [Spirochaetota bacterium]
MFLQIKLILTVGGGLGIFIYGMKLLSESLENAAGENLKKILSSMTNNRFFGVFTGFFVTSIVQSSSATTVMVVSFVNAGLLTLKQAVSVIMGANIGTTITAWIVNLTNIKTDLTLVAYLAIAIGIVMVFMKNNKRKTWGFCLIGFGLLFIGLTTMKKGIPRPDEDEATLLFQFFERLSVDNFAVGVVIFIILGTLLTMFFQSSSVTMALTLTFLSLGYIRFEYAAAMVLGENIGTTFTAFLASLAGNKMAKKAAFAHTFFNLLGVTWMLLLFKPFLILCGNVSEIFQGSGEIGFRLAIFHSMFNITNTLTLVWFIPYIVMIIEKVFGAQDKKVEYNLIKMQGGIVNTPDLAIYEAQQEINRMAEASHEAFEHTLQLFEAKKKKGSIIEKIEHYESQTDVFESEINTFLVQLMANTNAGSTISSINRMLDEIRHLEWIGDSCERIARLINKAGKLNYELATNNEQNFSKILKKLDSFFHLFLQNINDLRSGKIKEKSILLESDIDQLYKKMKKDTRDNMKSKNIGNGLLFLDIIKELEHIGDNLNKIIIIYNDDF